MAGCTALATPIPPTSTPIPLTATLVEQYQKIDSNELDIVVEGSLKSLLVDSDGNIDDVEGTVTKLTVEGKLIGLSSDKILLEGREAFIATKDYGKIKITFNSTGGVTAWLKPSQKERLKELVK
jgi:hypothetical protein